MANIISSSGQLHHYIAPITVAEVLLSINDDLSESFFLCNSDSLFYEEYIKPMSMEDQLQSGQIYFQLPLSKLRHPLTASDMAALAVKAALALQRIPSANQKNRISPFEIFDESKRNSFRNDSLLGSRSLIKCGSVRKSQRFSSRRTRMTMAARSFRMRLSTIYEGSVLLL
ncbi:uncharacterized protein LOC124924386 [Impatiens glandulifera]|uniref:uncharacterized protein LOC124924386 n=1 Tax=Impatiens glandulifera TaxID=253017 RepID=UPI001FB0F101|nr:uncharacterized protein LOC124924386 [Impatiens glandulifera]